MVHFLETGHGFLLQDGCLRLLRTRFPAVNGVTQSPADTWKPSLLEETLIAIASSFPQLFLA
jgi:hypothetical protein